MMEYTVDNNADLKTAFGKGCKAAKEKYAKKSAHSWKVYVFDITANPYTATGSFGKKLKAAWHNGFTSVRNTK